MNYLWAFLIGGVLCAVGQLFIDLTKLTPARILTGYVAVSYTHLDVYKRQHPDRSQSKCWGSYGGNCGQRSDP